MTDTTFIEDFQSIIPSSMEDQNIPYTDISTCSQTPHIDTVPLIENLSLCANFNNQSLCINEGTSSSVIDKLCLSLERCFNEHRGTLYLRIGPMFSGKTTWLDGELTELVDTGFQVLKITHSDDIRTDVASCDDSGSTHNSSHRSLSDKIVCMRASQLSNIDVSQYHVIGIDESQFFPDLLEIVQDWVENLGKHVRVSGLDGDAFKRKFGQTLDLIPFSDEVVKLNARCDICLEELRKINFRGNILAIVGPFTKRLGTSTAQKEVGGSDKYIPVCRFHHSL